MCAAVQGFESRWVGSFFFSPLQILSCVPHGKLTHLLHLHRQQPGVWNQCKKLGSTHVLWSVSPILHENQLAGPQCLWAAAQHTTEQERVRNLPFWSACGENCDAFGVCVGCMGCTRQTCSQMLPCFVSIPTCERRMSHSRSSMTQNDTQNLKNRCYVITQTLLSAVSPQLQLGVQYS